VKNDLLLSVPVGAARPEIPNRPVPAGTALTLMPEAVPASGAEGSVWEQLFRTPQVFNFFQAVRLLEQADPERSPVGRGGPLLREAVRFRVFSSLDYPASSIYDLQGPTPDLPVPAMTIWFLGLTGFCGVLPLHYTEMLLRQERESPRDKNRFALRDWFDLFNHRLTSLFYRAWEKYRFYVSFERVRERDAFTNCLLSVVGLGEDSLHNRLRVAVREPDADGDLREHVLARIDDLGLLHYSGYLAHWPRNAVSLEALLQDFFQLLVKVRQFQGQWLLLEPSNQSRLGAANSELGTNMVAGERVWDVQNKIRIRLGPLTYHEFNQFLPDREPVPQRKALFLLSHLVRLYVGIEFDFDVQLVLRKEDVPACQLTEGAGVGPQLGRNTWVAAQEFTRDAEDAVFDGQEVVFLR
jgi:type VI secretion system protein ImpH